MMLSVIIPTLNEQDAIGETLDSIHEHLKSYKSGYEIIIVDSESTDNTVKIAKAAGASVINEPRQGYGQAYMTGFKHVKGDIIATLDADATYPVSRILDLVKVLESGYDFVSGTRVSKGGSLSFKHRLGNKAITICINVLFFRRFIDSQSGMWVFRSSLLPKLDLRDRSWPFSGEIKIEASKYRFIEVPINYSFRKGDSKIQSWSVGLQNIKFAFKKRFGIL